MDEAEHGLHDLLLERLLADAAVDDQVAGLVLASWEGEEELASALEGQPSAASDPRAVPQREPGALRQPGGSFAAAGIHSDATLNASETTTSAPIAVRRSAALAT